MRGWILAAALLVGAGAQASDRWTPELAMQVQTIGTVVPSPDGSLVTWVQTRAVMETERSEMISDLWLATSDGRDRIRLTHGPHSCGNPAWSPDSRWIYFTSNRPVGPSPPPDSQTGERPVNVFRIAVRGGEAEPVTTVRGAIRRFEISPDGNRLAFTLVEPDPALERARKEKTDFRVVDPKKDNAVLYVIALGGEGRAPAPPRALTKPDRHVTEIAWSPDGATLAFVYWESALVNEWRGARLAEVEVESAAIRELASVEAFGATVFYSPDSRLLAFPRRSSPKPYPGTTRIAVLERSTGALQELAPTPNQLPALLGWLPEGRGVLVSEAYRTRSAIYEVPLKGPVRRLYAPEAGVFGAVKANAKASHVGVAYETSEQPPEAYVLARGQDRLVRVSEANQHLPKPPLGRTEIVRWKHKDGTEIEALLTLPPSYKPGTRAPLILNIHGGPASVFSEQFLGRPGIYPLAAFASLGYAVLRPNPRGSGGYGHSFRVANLADWGGRDYEDIQTGVDELIAKGIVDPERMAVMGWSYGGYMTSWTITQSHRFKAAVVGAAVTNLLSFQGTTDIFDFLPDYFGGEFYEVLDKYIGRSPVVHAHKVRTPTLVLHGEADVRVPVSQGYEFYHAVRRRGVPAEMVVYPRMPHVPEEPKFILDLMRRHLDWVQKWLRN